MQITLNTVSNDEHVPEIERRIRTTKERIRCVSNTLPFTRIPSSIIIEMVYCSNFWLNCFASMDGIADTIGPAPLWWAHKLTSQTNANTSVPMCKRTKITIALCLRELLVPLPRVPLEMNN